jgi:hypothetical protein
MALGRGEILKKFAISPRLEYYCDCDGFWTGVPQPLKEFTLTGERKLNDSSPGSSGATTGRTKRFFNVSSAVISTSPLPWPA